MRNLYCLLLGIFFLAGCSVMPPLDFTVQDLKVSNVKIDASLKSIDVALAIPDTGKSSSKDGFKTIVPLWKSALESALNTTAIFKDNSSHHLNLSVKILDVDIPAFGSSMTTKVMAHYELIDREKGGIVYSQDISSSGVVPFNYAFVGAVRARESLNRGIQNNISAFIESLKKLDINKLLPDKSKN